MLAVCVMRVLNLLWVQYLLPVNSGWDMNFTLGYNKNEITDLAGSRENLSGTSILGVTYWTKINEGKPIGTILWI